MSSTRNCKQNTCSRRPDEDVWVGGQVYDVPDVVGGCDATSWCYMCVLGEPCYVPACKFSYVIV